MQPVLFQERVDELGRISLLPAIREALHATQGTILALCLEAEHRQIALTGIAPQQRAYCSHTTRIDANGRIIIPLPFLFSLDIERNDVCMQFVKENMVLLKKTPQRCRLCGAGHNLRYYRHQYICSSCLRRLRYI